MDPIEIALSVAVGLVLFWMGWQGSGLTKMRAMLHVIHDDTRDLVEWHKPDANGRQLWKNPDLSAAIDELIVEIRGLRGDFTGVIPKLQEEHRAQDRGVADLSKQVADIKATLERAKGT